MLTLCYSIYYQTKIGILLKWLHPFGFKLAWYTQTRGWHLVQYWKRSNMDGLFNKYAFMSQVGLMLVSIRFPIY